MLTNHELNYNKIRSLKTSHKYLTRSSQLLELTQEIKSLHNYDVPVMGVVTQVDELAPLSNSEPPFEHSAKQENIEATVSILREKINEVITKPIHVIPISAYMEFSEDGTIVYDKRWNIDVLLHYLLLELPEEAQVILAKLSKIKSVQKNLARTIRKSVMTVTGL